MRRLAALLLLAACSGSSSGPPLVAPNALDLSGTWRIRFESQYTTRATLFEVDFVHDPIAGVLSWNGATYRSASPGVGCWPNQGEGMVDGLTLSATAYLYAEPGPSEYIGDAVMVGHVEGDYVSGAFTIPTGPCAGDYGTWEAFLQ